MGWKKLLGDAKGKVDEMAENRRQANEEKERLRLEEEERKKEYQAKVNAENEKVRLEQEKIKLERERQIQEFEDKVNAILDKFEISHFNDFLKRYLNKTNVHGTSTSVDGVQYSRALERKEYVDYLFGFLRSRQINYNHLKDFALKTKLVVPSFFGVESDEVSDRLDFENIINSIKADFQPENIKDEKELQSQLTIFIKAKFPGLKIEREVVAKSGDKLDIVIDNDYVLELKVPKDKTQLRNLSAQLEEYAEEYPNLCVVIADISGQVSINNDGTELEAKLTENIKEYTDRYLRKYKVPSIILKVGMRS